MNTSPSVTRDAVIPKLDEPGTRPVSDSPPGRVGDPAPAALDQAHANQGRA